MNINITKMSSETGIHVKDIRYALSGSKNLEEQCRKALEKANTIEEVTAVYEKIPYNFEVEKEVLVKWEALCKEALAGANTIEEIVTVYKKTPDASAIEREAIKKLATFYAN